MGNQAVPRAKKTPVPARCMYESVDDIDALGDQTLMLVESISTAAQEYISSFDTSGFETPSAVQNLGAIIAYAVQLHQLRFE